MNALICSLQRVISIHNKTRNQWHSPGVTRDKMLYTNPIYHHTTLLLEGNDSYTSVTEKVKRNIDHNVLPLGHCNFLDCQRYWCITWNDCSPSSFYCYSLHCTYPWMDGQAELA